VGRRRSNRSKRPSVRVNGPEWASHECDVTARGYITHDLRERGYQRANVTNFQSNLSSVRRLSLNSYSVLSPTLSPLPLISPSC
jgi:hypothetical protein